VRLCPWLNEPILASNRPFLCSIRPTQTRLKCLWPVILYRFPPLSRSTICLVAIAQLTIGEPFQPQYGRKVLMEGASAFVLSVSGRWEKSTRNGNPKPSNCSWRFFFSSIAGHFPGKRIAAESKPSLKIAEYSYYNG